jgi:hypothetical protein
MPLIAPKTCAFCLEAFTPTTATQRYCRRRCVSQHKRFTQAGQAPVAANQALRARYDEHRQCEIDRRFGTLSQRELDIYRWVYRKAYTDGYNAANHKHQIRRRSAA